MTDYALRTLISPAHLAILQAFSQIFRILQGKSTKLLQFMHGQHVKIDNFMASGCIKMQNTFMAVPSVIDQISWNYLGILSIFWSCFPRYGFNNG
jgi:hypothetical protein